MCQNTRDGKFVSQPLGLPFHFAVLWSAKETFLCPRSPLILMSADVDRSTEEGGVTGLRGKEPGQRMRRPEHRGRGESKESSERAENVKKDCNLSE